VIEERVLGLIPDELADEAEQGVWEVASASGTVVEQGQ
jgi:hypothetical protein